MLVWVLVSAGAEPRRPWSASGSATGYTTRPRNFRAASSLADEPTGALDSKTGAEIIALFQELHSKFGQTVIYVTHDPAIALHTDRISRVSDGRITGDDRVVNPLQ